MGYWAMPGWLIKNSTVTFSNIGVPTTQAQKSEVAAAAEITLCSS